MHKSRSKRSATKRLSKISGECAGGPFDYPDHNSGSAGREGQCVTIRDMRGYGANPPDPKWPGGAHVAVQFVVNYEEGGENCVLHGDAASEAFLSEIVGAAALARPCATGTWNRSTNTARAPASGGCTACSPRPTCRSPLRRRHRACALARPGRGDAGGRLGDRLARAEMDRLPRPCDRRTSAADMEEAIRLHCEVTGAAADRLVHRPHLGQHGAAGRRGRRLRLCLRHL